MGRLEAPNTVLDFVNLEGDGIEDSTEVRLIVEPGTDNPRALVTWEASSSNTIQYRFYDPSVGWGAEGTLYADTQNLIAYEIGMDNRGEVWGISFVDGTGTTGDVCAVDADCGPDSRCTSGGVCDVTMATLATTKYVFLPGGGMGQFQEDLSVEAVNGMATKTDLDVDEDGNAILAVEEWNSSVGGSRVAVYVNFPLF